MVLKSILKSDPYKFVLFGKYTYIRLWHTGFRSSGIRADGLLIVVLEVRSPDPSTRAEVSLGKTPNPKLLPVEG